jgi:lipopolysaccharide export system protein LptC
MENDMSTLEIVLIILSVLVACMLAYLISKYKEKVDKIIKFSRKIDFKSIYSNLKKYGLLDKIAQAIKYFDSKKK